MPQSAARRQAGRIGRHEGEWTLRVPTIFREIEMHATNQSPPTVAGFQELVERESAFGEFGLQSLSDLAPVLRQRVGPQVCAAADGRRVINQRRELARCRRGELRPAGGPRRIAKRAEFGDEVHAEIPPPRQRGRQDASGLARTEVKKAMTGTAFEPLLEPITQPALEHEIVIGLIKAERPMRSHPWNKRARNIPKS